MGFKENWKEEMKKSDERVRAKQEKQVKLSETEKFAKQGNFIIKGIALWYILPAIAILVFILMLLGAWVWGMIF